MNSSFVGALCDLSLYHAGDRDIGLFVVVWGGFCFSFFLFLGVGIRFQG